MQLGSRVRIVCLVVAIGLIGMPGAPAAGQESKLVYGITSDGRLEWSAHAGWRDGSSLTAPTTVGTGWGGFTKVFPGCDGVVYAIQPNGDLLWFKHTGAASGSAEWEGPKTVGTGWGHFREVFADCTGAVYAITPEGELQWRRHVGVATGTLEWQGHTVVGSGWTTFDKVFSGCRGTIYGIKPTGELLWYDHLDPTDGAPEWRGPEVVGSGWTMFAKVFSGCDGIIYGLKPTGELVWYHHTGYTDGESEWMEPREIRTGASWSNAFSMPLMAPVRPPETACPAIDALGAPGAGSFHFNRFPPEEKSIYRATWVSPDGARDGKAGVDHIVDVVMRSLKPGCAPVRVVHALAGADLDSRGREFEDHISNERAWQGANEIKAALEAVRTPAVARGEIVDLRVYFSAGGIGSRRLIHPSPTSEAQREANRWLVVDLVQEHQPGATPTAAGSEAAPHRQ